MSLAAAESAVEALLREISTRVEVLRTEVQGLRADLAQNIQFSRRRENLPPLSRADRALLGRLLPAITGVLGSEPFTSRDLTCHSAPGLRLVVRQLSAKSIGRLLARADGVPIEGWLVERRGVEINVALWRVVAMVSHRLESGAD